MFSLGTTLFELMTHRDLPGIIHDVEFSNEIKHGRRPRFLPMVCIKLIDFLMNKFFFRIPNIPQYLMNACSAVGVKTTSKDLVQLKLHKCSNLHIILAFYIPILLVEILKDLVWLCLVMLLSTFG